MIKEGLRLHGKLFWYNLTFKDLKHGIYLHFKSIEDGLNAERILRDRIPFLSIPTPDKIMKECGVSIITEKPDEATVILRENDIELATTYSYANGEFIEGRVAS